MYGFSLACLLRVVSRLLSIPSGVPPTLLIKDLKLASCAWLLKRAISRRRFGFLTHEQTSEGGPYSTRLRKIISDCPPIRLQLCLFVLSFVLWIITNRFFLPALQYPFGLSCMLWVMTYHMCLFTIIFVSSICFALWVNKGIPYLFSPALRSRFSTTPLGHWHSEYL